MKHALILAGLIGAAALPPAIAQTANEQPVQHLAQATGPATTPMADGEVRKIDKDAGKITLQHGPIPNLEMPAMTMVFRVKDPAMLDRIKAGDKVRFSADRIGGQFTVTRIEPVK